MKMKPSSLLLTTLASVILTACGGGSSGANNSSSSASDTSSSIISTSSSSSVVSSVVAESSLSSSSSSSQVSSEDSGITSSSSSAISSSSSSLAPNIAPVFTSDGMVSLAEGVTVTGFTATATDANGDALIYAITGGADQDLFTIDATTGALSFVLAPDFEAPSDADTNNVYLVQIEVSDGRGGSAEQSISINVLDAAPRLTSLHTTNEGLTLTAHSDCEECDLSKTQYTWYLEGTDEVVATGDTFTVPVEDKYKKITLTATSFSQSGVLNQDAHVVLTWNQVEDFRCHFPDGEIKGCPIAIMTNGELRPFGQAENPAYYGLKDVKDIYTDGNMYVVLKNDGGIVYWGGRQELWDVFPDDLDGGDNKFIDVVFSSFAVAALREDGTVVTWGRGTLGWDSSGLDLTNVKKIYANRIGFAALKNDGTVVTWGDSYSLGNVSSLDLTNVVSITPTPNEKYYGNGAAFAALKSDGSVVVWGSASAGGDSGDLVLNNVSHVYSTKKGDFLALMADGTAKAWGGDISLEQGNSSELKDITQVKAGVSAFAVLRQDGTVVAIGDGGGSTIDVTLENIQSIYATDYAFAAMNLSNTLVPWGSKYSGGVAGDLDLTGITDVIEGAHAFAAYKDDGSINLWGVYSGNHNILNAKDVILRGYGGIVLKNDGSIFCYTNYGSCSDAGSDHQIERIFSINDFQTAGITDDGELFLWGNDNDGYGGDRLGDISLESEFIELSNSLKIN